MRNAKICQSDAWRGEKLFFFFFLQFLWQPSGFLPFKASFLSAYFWPPDAYKMCL